jgi:hypothetical protein
MLRDVVVSDSSGQGQWVNSSDSELGLSIYPRLVHRHSWRVNVFYNIGGRYQCRESPTSGEPKTGGNIEALTCVAQP